MNLPSILRQFRHLGIASLVRNVETPSNLSQSSKFPCGVHLISQRWKADDRRELIKSMPLKDMGTQGEKLLDVDLVNVSKENIYPDGDTPNLLFDGVRFAELPICHIKATKNNTILAIHEAGGKRIAYRSCGMDGFKNTRKGTNIAAQTTAIAVCTEAKDRGVSNVRVLIQGLGPGRMSAVKGMQMAGLKVVSVTDNTPISFTPPRPRKARRL